LPRLPTSSQHEDWRHRALWVLDALRRDLAYAKRPIFCNKPLQLAQVINFRTYAVEELDGKNWQRITRIAQKTSKKFVKFGQFVAINFELRNS
jgi:hypothetical protein